MQLIDEISDVVLQPEPGVATIGFFDGVHRGHRFLIEQVRRAAAERGLASSVITFPVHPRRVMQSGFRPELLTTCEEKVALLADTGVDYCIMLPFTPDVARLSARQFMSVLKEKYRIQALVVGHDHRFGHNRSEGFDDYVRYGRELGMEVLLARAYYINNEKEITVDNKTEITVSSSAIRRLLHEGDVSKAAEYLGYEYFLEGSVVDGYRVGRKIGFPTANLRVDDPDKLVPSDGVYAVRVRLDGEEYGGMLSIGYRPTLNNGSNRSIEVHIFHFKEDIYGQPMRISFVRRTRSELKFDTTDELIARLHQDEAEIKAILSVENQHTTTL